MFRGLFDFGQQRNGQQATVFYAFYLIILLLVGAIPGFFVSTVLSIANSIGQRYLDSQLMSPEAVSTQMIWSKILSMAVLFILALLLENKKENRMYGWIAMAIALIVGWYSPLLGLIPLAIFSTTTPRQQPDVFTAVSTPIVPPVPAPPPMSMPISVSNVESQNRKPVDFFLPFWCFLTVLYILGALGLIMPLPFGMMAAGFFQVLKIPIPFSLIFYPVHNYGSYAGGNGNLYAMVTLLAIDLIGIIASFVAIANIKRNWRWSYVFIFLSILSFFVSFANIILGTCTFSAGIVCQYGFLPALPNLISNLIVLGIAVGTLMFFKKKFVEAKTLPQVLVPATLPHVDDGKTVGMTNRVALKNGLIWGAVLAVILFFVVGILALPIAFFVGLVIAIAPTIQRLSLPWAVVLNFVSILVVMMSYFLNPGGGGDVYYGSLLWWQQPGILLLALICVFLINFILFKKNTSSFVRVISMVILIVSACIGLYILLGMGQYEGNHFG
jgi:hypothetical protein